MSPEVIQQRQALLQQCLREALSHSGLGSNSPALREFLGAPSQQGLAPLLGPDAALARLTTGRGVAGGTMSGAGTLLPAAGGHPTAGRPPPEEQSSGQQVHFEGNSPGVLNGSSLASTTHRRTASSDVATGTAGREAGAGMLGTSQQSGRRASAELPGGGVITTTTASRGRVSSSGGDDTSADVNNTRRVMSGLEGSSLPLIPPGKSSTGYSTTASKEPTLGVAGSAGNSNVNSTSSSAAVTSTGHGKGISTTVRLLVDLLPKLSDGELAAAQGGVCAGCKGPLPEVPSPSAAAAAAWLTLSFTQSKGPRR
jgi:hypothetical protein